MADQVVPPAAFTHVVYRTGDIGPMRDWYITLLGAHVVFENPRVCFLTYDDEHHRVAFVAKPDLASATTEVRGLDHVAYSYDSLETLLDVYERLRAGDILPYWTVNHGPTTSFYYRDPDGNGVELQVDNYPTTAELHGFFSTPEFASNPRGVDVDPADLRARLDSGEAIASLLIRADVATPA